MIFPSRNAFHFRDYDEQFSFLRVLSWDQNQKQVFGFLWFQYVSMILDVFGEMPYGGCRAKLTIGSAFKFKDDVGGLWRTPRFLGGCGRDLASGMQVLEGIFCNHDARLEALVVRLATVLKIPGSAARRVENHLVEHLDNLKRSLQTVSASQTICQTLIYFF